MVRVFVITVIGCFLVVVVGARDGRSLDSGAIPLAQTEQPTVAQSRHGTMHKSRVFGRSEPFLDEGGEMLGNFRRWIVDEAVVEPGEIRFGDKSIVVGAHCVGFDLMIVLVRTAYSK